MKLFLQMDDAVEMDMESDGSEEESDEEEETEKKVKEMKPVEEEVITQVYTFFRIILQSSTN